MEQDVFARLFRGEEQVGIGLADLPTPPTTESEKSDIGVFKPTAIAGFDISTCEFTIVLDDGRTGRVVLDPASGPNFRFRIWGPLNDGT
ncbi:hypothetical protein [Allocoleopsis franciscana]|uniref:Uncharacterized protein n=1 Tax=Allocoleopsis franciscana PCC 7113 TaxID=1173027 RepID=K9WF72_9CYAN|nr:hypothetical protein [Allocoleopsis franciscana]AFZ18868.1 hypothetical protein Mic7113_3122 [Allocoleopsis franciscana PCC 7113]